MVIKGRLNLPIGRPFFMPGKQRSWYHRGWAAGARANGSDVFIILVRVSGSFRSLELGGIERTTDQPSKD